MFSSASFDFPDGTQSADKCQLALSTNELAAYKILVNNKFPVMQVWVAFNACPLNKIKTPDFVIAYIKDDGANLPVLDTVLVTSSQPHPRNPGDSQSDNLWENQYLQMCKHLSRFSFNIRTFNTYLSS